jgi:hypothetical protein
VPSLGNDCGLSDSDLDLSSDDYGYWSGKEPGRSRVSKHSRWPELDEQRLLEGNGEAVIGGRHEARRLYWYHRINGHFVLSIHPIISITTTKAYKEC